MCRVLPLLAFFVFGGTSLSFAEARTHLQLLAPRAQIVASVEGNSVTMRLPQAIASGLVSSDTITIQRGDTLGSLLTKNGFRFDPVSTRLVYELNPFLMDAGHLQVNKTIHLPRITLPEHGPRFTDVKVKLDQDVKQDLNSLIRTLARQSSGVYTWADGWSGNELVLQVKTLFQETTTNMNRLKITGYALPRETLEETGRGIQAFNSIVTEMIEKNQLPNSGQMRFINAVSYNVGRLTTAAKNINVNKVPVEVATHLSDGTPVNWLSICYRYELDYSAYKFFDPDSEPSWSCTPRFGTPTTPAKDILSSQRYTILGT